MKIINLIEDTEGQSGCRFEHGLSFYIETENHKLLLDTGASDAFIENAKIRGICLEDADTVVISHGHYDHAGGVFAFAKINPNAKIYIHKNARGEFYSFKGQNEKYIGMDKAIAELPQVIFTEGNIVIDGELSIFCDVRGRRLWPRGNKVLKRKTENGFTEDSFDHEMYLVVSEAGKRVLLSGCAHNGILNILESFGELYGGAPDCVISGFHTVKAEYTEEDGAIIRKIAEELAATDIRFYSGHCTGEYAMEILLGIMGEQLRVIHSGDVIM